MNSKIKNSLITTFIIFIIGGLWQPILIKTSSLTIEGFLGGGIYSIIILWAGGYLIYRCCKTKPSQ